MSEITRYWVYPNGFGGIECVVNDEGEWVDYEDHTEYTDELRKIGGEWFKWSQRNLQRAKDAEAKLSKAVAFLNELYQEQSYETTELLDLIKYLEGETK